MIHNYYCTFLYHLNLLLLLCWLRLQLLYLFSYKHVFLKCSPLWSFQYFWLFSIPCKTYWNTVFPTSLIFVYTRFFITALYPYTLFFWKPCFHTRKITFSEKNISPSLNVHFWEIIHDIISLSPNSSTLKCILKSTSIKNHSQPSGHEQSFLIFQFFQIPK